MPRKPIKDLYIPSGVEEDILNALSNNDKLYGLEIIDAIEEASQGERKIGLGSLYPTLHRLEKKKKLVKSRWGEEEDGTGGARRKYYNLTPLGKRSLEDLHKYRTKLYEWQSPSTKQISPSEHDEMLSSGADVAFGNGGNHLKKI
ncbi:transcriptional regulator PadR family protein (plasmid) [Thalassoporum mexicanum PCC 7367]|uniref:PadR family transcriptional regulator n=1 Tax=Thalassoporum mexicanum TaxID=3457544 RepID=UPI00029F8809|nr:PadR family transcriptional regulator [Pseudanabaena sp. PCC 7367]AFY72009.1 transcriptional regulator PadR family protein [Pseudanabaena sp. PCC 7367]